MLSFSDTNMMDASDRTGLVDDMEAFINSDFDGRVTRPLVVTLTTARRDRRRRPTAARHAP